MADGFDDAGIDDAAGPVILRPDMSDAPFTVGSIHLADGRRLAFAETGPKDGLPILYLHGAIGAPLNASPELADTIARLRLGWITLQRPGFGDSHPLRGRTLLDLADDVRALAAALELERIAIVGVSALVRKAFGTAVRTHWRARTASRPL